MKRPNDKPSELNIIASSPFHVYFEGTAQVLSAYNPVGAFDILPGHTSFFSVLEAGIVVIDKGDGSDLVQFEVTNGIITVRDDTVELFINL